MKRIGWAVLAAVAWCGAAWAQIYAPYETATPRIPSADTGDYRDIHRIAVISALESNFRMRSRQGDDKILADVDVAAWKIDELVAATLRKYLAGRFELVDADLDRAGLLAVPEFMRESRTLELLKKQPIADVDAYVIVRPVGDPAPEPGGIGLHAGKNGVALCANYEIDVIDAHRWSFLGKAVSRMQTHAGTPAMFACYAESPSVLMDMIRGPSDDTLDDLGRQLRALVPRSLVETLRALELGIALPPPGDHSIAPPDNAVDTEGIASVAVISAIGGSFAFASPHDMLHEEELVETPIADWGLDAEVERIAGTALSRKFTVKAAELDRAALARVVLRERTRPKIEGLPPSADVDAYVLIVKAQREGTGSSGAGLWNQDWMGRSTYAYVNYAVMLVDARTLKVLKAALPVMGPDSGIAFPLLRVDGKLWPDGAKDHAAADKAHATISALIAGSVPETLYQMGLTKDEAAR